MVSNKNEKIALPVWSWCFCCQFWLGQFAYAFGVVIKLSPTIPKAERTLLNVHQALGSSFFMNGRLGHMACVIVVCRAIFTLQKPLLRTYLEGSSVRHRTLLKKATIDGSTYIKYVSMQAPYGCRNKSLNDLTKKAPTTLKAGKTCEMTYPKARKIRDHTRSAFRPTQKRLYLLALNRFWSGPFGFGEVIRFWSGPMTTPQQAENWK